MRLGSILHSLLASLGVALCLRAISPSVRRVSECYLWLKEAPILSKRISVGGDLYRRTSHRYHPRSGFDIRGAEYYLESGL